MNDKPQHTPGPWRAGPWEHDGNAACVFREGTLIARVVYLGGTEKAEANAALIARAPDLLAQVERLTEQRNALAVALEDVTAEFSSLMGDVWGKVDDDTPGQRKAAAALAALKGEDDDQG